MTDVAAMMSGAVDTSAQAGAGDGQSSVTQDQSAEVNAAQGQVGADGQADQSGSSDNTTDGSAGEFQLKASDATIFDQDLVGRFSDIAKGAKLDQTTAQQVMDGVSTLIAERNQKAIADARASWAEQTKSDKELGGEKLAENLGIARKALSTFGSPELDDLLTRTGLSTNPHFIRAWYRAGKAISEDHITTGQPTQTKSDARAFYPNSNMN